MGERGLVLFDAPSGADPDLQSTEATVLSSSGRARLTGGALGAQPVAMASRERCARIVDLDRSIAALTAERASLLVAERDCGEWRKAGYSTFEAWRGQMSGEGQRTARAQLTVATVLDESPEAAEAVSAGEVTVVHAGILGRVRSRAERPGSQALTPTESQELLDLAKKEDADSFAKTADRWWARRDSLAHDATHEEIRRKRFLTISHTSHGTHIKGFLDGVAGRRVAVAVDAAMSRPDSGDDRDYAQRMADALVDVADRAINGGSLKNGAAVRPHVSVIMTEETFVQARRELRRRATEATGSTGSTGSTDDEGAALFGSPAGGKHDPPPDTPSPVAASGAPQPVEPVTFEDGTPVPLSEVARILCDAEFTRIVMTAENVPVNLGRSVRLYSREQRRAIIARDRGCQFRACTQPVQWCEIHHVDWWSNGGETSLDNGILLCSFHHHEVHRLNLTVDRDVNSTNGARDARGARLVRITHGTERAECRVDSGPTRLALGPAPTTPSPGQPQTPTQSRTATPVRAQGLLLPRQSPDAAPARVHVRDPRTVRPAGQPQAPQLYRRSPTEAGPQGPQAALRHEAILQPAQAMARPGDPLRQARRHLPRQRRPSAIITWLRS